MNDPVHPRLVKSVDNAGNLLFDLYEQDGNFIARYDSDRTIEYGCILDSLYILDDFARNTCESEISLLLDFSKTPGFDPAALRCIRNLESFLKQMSPPPFFLAVAIMVPDGME